MTDVRVVVTFKPGRQPAYKKGAHKGFTGSQAQEWKKIAGQFAGISLDPHLTSRSATTIDKLENMAGMRAAGARSLKRHFVVVCPSQADANSLAAALATWPDIESAIVEPTATDATVNGPLNPQFSNQGYLRAAPAGIDAVFAWTQAGGDGKGQHFADIEQGWTVNHADLVSKGITVINGGIADNSRFHGTAVMGQVCAVDNTIGCVGIVPNLASVTASSVTGSTVSNAILSAIARLSIDLNATGIILIEQQWVNYNGWKLVIVEVAPDVYDAIQLATQLGHLVVEAAGNGSIDLDTYQANGQFVLNRADPNFRDSGALVVGAASWALPHARLSFSNFGSRIDCYGWGENVTTCSSNDTGATTGYTNSFNGTSSASPIIAGAALAVQGMSVSSGGVTINPTTLRRILSDPGNGTASVTPSVDRIGVMPNLRLIASSVLQLVPDLYIRDNLGDTGQPTGGILSSSPDIILKENQIANPQLVYGEGSGTESNMQLGDKIGGGKDYYGYVRVRNRTAVPAMGAVARLYWSTPSTLVMPHQWNVIGAVQIDVPAGNQLTVAGPVVWPKANVPGPGHYCFVATISHPFDLAPDLASIDRVQNFSSFIAVNNNVAWRNFDVADIRPQGTSEASQLPFDVGNPEGGAFVDMRVEVGADLPPGSRLFLQMPAFVQPSAGLSVMPGTQPNTIRVELNSKGITEPFRSQILPVKTSMVLQAQIPSHYWNGAYEVFARQLYKGHEVGRVTWLLKLPLDTDGKAGKQPTGTKAKTSRKRQKRRVTEKA